MAPHCPQHEFSLGFRLDGVSQFAEAGNLIPGEAVAIVRISPETGKREIKRVRWGLVPGFVEDPRDLPDLIHARAETLEERFHFRAAFRERRCLIPADGFPVWNRVEDERRRHWIRHRDPERLLALAGIWEVWTPPRIGEEDGPPEELESCAMITVPANELVGRFQDRMPAILEPHEWEAWLDPATGPAAVKALLRPYPDDELRVIDADR